MTQDYRLSEEEAASLSPYEIVEAVVYKIDHDFPELSYADEDDVCRAKADLDPVYFEVHAAWMTAGYAANGGVWHVIDTSSRSYIEAAVQGYELLGESQASKSIRVVLDTLDRAIAAEMEFDDYYEQHEDDIPLVEFEADRYVSEFFRNPTILESRRNRFITPNQGESGRSGD